LGTERVARTDEEIANMCEKHRQLFICWDEYFSGLRIKRFHLTDAIAKKTREFLVRSVLLERHLGMSITPKTHVMDDDSMQQLIATHGFADLGEDAGERNHQDEAKADRRLLLVVKEIQFFLFFKIHFVDRLSVNRFFVIVVVFCAVSHTSI
jgi:hypothetical protein